MSTKDHYEMPKVTVVSRKKWLRGNTETSGLLIERKMCCLGFSCSQAGVNKSLLKDIGMPSEIRKCFDRVSVGGLTDEVVGHDTELARVAADINDNADFTDKERERQLKNLFKEHGKKIVFKP